MLRNKFFLHLLFIFVFSISAAQDKTLIVKHITSENGLSDNQVTCILRDKQGFIWIGTKDGLNRYDGREFYVFRHVENDSLSLCGNNITCLAYDDDSLLWIGTASSGFCSYDFRTGEFTSYNKKNTALFSNNFNAITFDKRNHQLWLALNNYGLQVFDLKNKKIKIEPGYFPEENHGTYYDVVVSDSTIYTGKISGQLWRINSNKLYKSHFEGIAWTINKIFLASDKNIWCGMWDNALHEFDTNFDSEKHYFFDGSDRINFSGDEILSVAEDANEILWCGTKVSGIHLFNLRSKTFLKNRKFSHSITSRINCIYRDNLSRMWVGTESGLYLYDTLKNQFTVTKLPIPPATSSCKVHDRVFTKGGKEFIVSTCGLFYKNAGDASYAFKEFFHKNEKLQLFSIFRDSKERIFIGTNKTIFSLDTTTLEIEMIFPGKKIRMADFYSITSSRVNSIAEVRWKEDTLVMPAFYGHTEFIIDFKRKNIFGFYPTASNIPSLFENLVRKIYVDSKNKIWVCGASQGVLQIVFPDTVSIDKYNTCDSITWLRFALHKWKNKNSNEIASINDVYDIAENNDGSYWLTTQGSGLIKFYPEDLSSPYVSYAGNYKSLQGLRKTDRENIWIVSSAGLLNYNIRNNRYISYAKSDGVSEGLSGYFFNDRSPFLSAGFDGGFISFNPHAILRDTEKPSAHITKLWVMDMVQDSLLFGNLQLTHAKNFLKFYVSSNCFSYNEQVIFMYFLEGIDNNWRSNQNNPLITYTNLPHGNFILKVKVINNDGVESGINSIAVVITPPFYETVYFYSGISILIIGAAYAFYKYRIKQIIKLQEVRNKIARDLHDDIGSTLGSIHLYSQIANTKLNTEKTGEIKSILQKIENSSSEIIEKTGDAVWAVKASNDTLKNLILRIESYAASLLGVADIHFNIIYDEHIADTKLGMTQRKNIFLIYKEAIHNIIKYADCTEVTINIKKSNDKLLISIADNGKGFTMNEVNPYNGNGIKNMKHRAEEIKGTFSIRSKENKGTVLDIIV